MRKFVLGDIHGAHKALIQCLERSEFDKEKDLLITLGDIVDGWEESYECVEELLTIKNRIDIRGNHDHWLFQYFQTGIHGSQWQQGADATKRSYGKRSMIIPDSHIRFFEQQHLYYVGFDNRCFVHGGFDRWDKIEHTPFLNYFWDRSLWAAAMSCTGEQKLNTIDDFSEIYLGHTQVNNGWNKEKCLPITRGGVTNLDTGAGWSGKLTIMNIDTKEYWQSDNVLDLYPGIKGRY